MKKTDYAKKFYNQILGKTAKINFVVNAITIKEILGVNQSFFSKEKLAIMYANIRV